MKLPTVGVSDHATRLARIQSVAEDVFGDAQKANRWLHEKLEILHGNSPIELAQTESGAQAIERILARIDWGAAL